MIARFIGLLFLVFLPQVVFADGLLQRPPTGISMLHCNHPNATASCDAIVRTIYNSQISQPAINYLVDGTFGFSQDRMMNDIAMLTEGGRVLHVAFYLVSGPAQRMCGTKYSDGFGASTCYKTFNRAIRADHSTQVGYQLHAAKLRPVVDFALSRGAHVYLAPMLEDNMDVATYKHMMDLILPFFPPRFNFHYLRNPGHKSDGKLPPATDAYPYGFVKEKHPHNLGQVNHWYGIAVNDGVGFKLPGGARTRAKQLSFSTLRKMRDAAHKRGTIFMAWNGEFQGIYSGQRLHSSQRNYYTLNSTQEQLMVQFLRGQ